MTETTNKTALDFVESSAVITENENYKDCKKILINNATYCKPEVVYNDGDRFIFYR